MRIDDDRAKTLRTAAEEAPRGHLRLVDGVAMLISTADIIDLLDDREEVRAGTKGLIGILCLADRVLTDDARSENRIPDVNLHMNAAPILARVVKELVDALDQLTLDDNARAVLARLRGEET